MIGETKEMIAGCIERMRWVGCGSCERRDACADPFPKAFGAGAPRPRPSRMNPFLAFLGEMARSMEKAREPRSAPPPGDSVRRAVEQRLETVIGTGEIGIERIARDLGYSRQTLYRRLKAEGTTFERLLDGLRRRLALRLVRKEGLSVKEAAYRLGFSDPAAFSRAFKRWTGTSPGESRRPN